MEEENPGKPHRERKEQSMLGSRMDEVPQSLPGRECNARRSRKISYLEDPEFEIDPGLAPDDRVFVGYCNNRSGFKTEHVGEGRCNLHGGGSPRGEDHPRFRHGLFSDYLGEEDRDAIRVLEDTPNPAKLQSMINWRLARLRRAVRELASEEDDDGEISNVWEAFEATLNRTGTVEAGEIRELASMLDSQNSSIRMEIETVRKMIKTHADITDGQKVNIDGDFRQEISGGESPVSIMWEQSRAEIEEQEEVDNDAE